jgi:UDP-N-acetylglucosamine 2-epimerase (non-hydrolysing)
VVRGAFWLGLGSLAVSFLGFAKVVGVNPEVVLAELEKTLSSDVELPGVSPFGDGKAAVRIVDSVLSRLET